LCIKRVEEGADSWYIMCMHINNSLNIDSFILRIAEMDERELDEL
jgi:hypothetical protein